MWTAGFSAHEQEEFSRANGRSNSRFFMQNGVVDLTLMAKTLDPDAMTLTLALVGHRTASLLV